MRCLGSGERVGEGGGGLGELGLAGVEVTAMGETDFSAKWWEGLQGGEKAASSCGMIGEVFEEGGGDSGGWGGLGLRLGLGVRLVVL